MERLTVKNLGPLKDFTLETNRLTVIIGPQASGKSLLAQMLYYFNNIELIAAELFRSDIPENGREEIISDFPHFAMRKLPPKLLQTNEGAHVTFTNNSENLSLSIKKIVHLDSNSLHKIQKLRNTWSHDKLALQNSLNPNSLFIPSERIMYSLFYGIKESLLYDPAQTYFMIKFSSLIGEAKERYSELYNKYKYGSNISHDFDKIHSLQRKTLGGTAESINNTWFWNIDGNTDKRLPLSGASSGQMSAWPFFVLSSVYGYDGNNYTCYYEEPELHLHPTAQLHLMQAISLMLARGHRLVITTHSPFILYIINTLIQAHIAYDGAVPEGEFSINPDHVAAYSLGEKSGSIVNPETRLLDLTEIDSVFDEINVSFGKYMDMEFAKHEK